MSADHTEPMLNKHFLFVSHPLWGHLRPDIAITSNLLALHPNLHVTILISGFRAHDAEQEYIRHGLNADQRRRLRRIHHGSVPREQKGLEKLPYDRITATMKDTVVNFMTMYPKLRKGEAVVDSSSAMDVARWTIPISLIAFDWSLSGTLPPIIAKYGPMPGGEKPKCVICSPLAPSFFDFYFFNNYKGEPVVDNMIKDVESGMDGENAWDKHIALNDTIINIPGCGPMRVSEIPGNDGTLRRVVDRLIIPARAAAKRDIDAFIVYHPAYLDQATEKAWIARAPLLLVGPLSPPPSDEAEVTTAEYGAEIIAFLDKSLLDHGERSLIFISFGSIHFPPDREQTTILFDVLVALNRPVLFVAGNCNDGMFAFLEDKAKSAEMVMLASWVPQQRLLRHKVVGCFLTHGGSGSIMESLSAGVPMVIWPDGTDQVFMANQLDVVHGLAVELVQIRKGPNAQASALRDELRRVLMSVMGGQGDELRRRIMEVSEIMQRDRQPGGKTYDSLFKIWAL
ncbi:MAG: hypothetical protein TREMPRED_000903 [Tremellales sp. Tagirdzhanova-0007]|nr:MAG: hypothetical protein TREMPRED_000903 [Tremellales sp. Tagirdzhanova-0007]